jgi:hypothetical protein
VRAAAVFHFSSHQRTVVRQQALDVPSIHAARLRSRYCQRQQSQRFRRFPVRGLEQIRIFFRLIADGSSTSALIVENKKPIQTHQFGTSLTDFDAIYVQYLNTSIEYYYCYI